MNPNQEKLTNNNHNKSREAGGYSMTCLVFVWELQLFFLGDVHLRLEMGACSQLVLLRFYEFQMHLKCCRMSTYLMYLYWYVTFVNGCFWFVPFLEDAAIW